MSNKKTPKDYFPFTDDDIIITEHMQKLIEQENDLINKKKPMQKLSDIFDLIAPKNKFFIRTNGAGQLSFYRPANSLKQKVFICISCRILTPIMGKNKNQPPILSFRFSLQIGEERFFFARLASIETENGEKSCNVCAIKSNDFDKYFFEGESGNIYTGSNLDTPITRDDLSMATKLTKEDLSSSIRLSSGLYIADRETKKILIHLMKAVNTFKL